MPMRKDKKNISKVINNGAFVLTKDHLLFGADGKSTKIRMATVVDSNRDDEVAIIKYTTSGINGKEFENNKGFDRFSNVIFTKDINGDPLTLNRDNSVIQRGTSKRDITAKQANMMKKYDLTESKYKKRNLKQLKELKGRIPKK